MEPVLHDGVARFGVLRLVGARVERLGQVLEQVAQELVRVLLPSDLEAFRDQRQIVSKFPGRYGPGSVGEEEIDEAFELVRRAEGRLLLAPLRVHLSPAVTRERRRVRQALQHGIHEA